MSRHILVLNGSSRAKSTNGLFIEAIIRMAGIARSSRSTLLLRICPTSTRTLMLTRHHLQWPTSASCLPKRRAC